MVTHARFRDRRDRQATHCTKQEAGVTEPGGYGASPAEFPGSTSLICAETDDTVSTGSVLSGNSFHYHFSAKLDRVIATDPGEIGVPRGFQILHKERAKTGAQPDAVASLKNIAQATNARKLIDVELLVRRPKLSLVEGRRDGRPVGSQKSDAEVQQHRGRDGLIVIDSARL